jgi:hypothetical protein
MKDFPNHPFLKNGNDNDNNKIGHDGGRDRSFDRSSYATDA